MSYYFYCSLTQFTFTFKCIYTTATVSGNLKKLIVFDINLLSITTYTKAIHENKF